MEFPMDPAVMARMEEFRHEDTYFEDEQDLGPEVTVLEYVLSRLSADERACVEMKHVAGMSYRQIAVELGMYFGDPPVVDAKKAWRTTKRGLRKLRKVLEGLDADLLV